MKNKALKPGWNWVKFGDVVRQCKNKVNPETSGLKRYIAGEHMDTDDLRLRRWGEIGSGYLGPAFHMHFKAGQVLYGSRRTYLRKVAIADFDGICANTTFVLESKRPDYLLPSFLPFLMQTDAFNRFSLENSKGSVNPYINFSDLARFEFVLPPIDEQILIVRGCKAAFDAAYAYEDALTASLIFQDSLREQLFSNECRSVPLGNLIKEIQAGKSVVGIDEPPSSNQENAVLKVSAVGKRSFLPQESKKLVNNVDFLSIHSVKAGDLLITRANTTELVGLVCLVSQTHKNLMLSDKTLRLIPEENVPKRLLLEAMRTKAARQYLKANATGTGSAMKNISQAKLREMPIKFPDVELRHEYASQLDIIDSKIEFIEARYKDAKQIAHLVIQKLLGSY